MMVRKWLARCRELWPEVCFAGSIYILLIMLFSLLRGLLLWRNLGVAADVPAVLLAQCFRVGLRFDLAVAAYLALPLLLLLLWRRGRRWRILLPCFYVLVGLTLLLGLAEIEFYHAIGSRFNTLVLNAMGHPWRLVRLHWQAYPMWSYLTLWGGLMLIVILVGRWVERSLLGFRARPGGIRDDMLHLMGSVVVLALLVILSRGGVGHQPLRQGDAVFCTSTFANQLALNGLFALGRCAWEEQKQAVLIPTYHAAY
jgi:hypothetical protein